MIKNIFAVIGAFALAKVTLDWYEKHVKTALEKTVADALND